MVVLDTWALLALFLDEPPAALVEDALISRSVAMSIMNLGEVLYISSRHMAEVDAKALIEESRSRMEVVPADWPLVEDAARIKSGGGLSYADAFCVATARRLGSDLWTGDPEILALAGEFDYRTRDLRA